jgi:crotonobetaine/carnitine-CoA ligase
VSRASEEDLKRIPSTIVELVDRAGHSHPERPAMIFDDGLTISRGELLERSERFAGYLREVTQPGEMVAAMTGNCTEFMIAWLATVASGCVFVALNPDAGEHDLAHVLTDSRAVLIVCDEPSAERLASLEPQPEDLRERLVLSGEEPGRLDRWQGSEPLRFSEAEIDPEAITNVYYTSGTTGPPKGCMVGHAYWRRLVSSYLGERGLGAEDRILCCLKFFYNDPSWQLLSSLQVGAALIVMRKFSVSRYWDVVRANDVTQLFTIGSIPALLLSAAPTERDREHKVRFGVQVAVDASLHREMTDRWGIPWMDAYGLTETGGLISVPPEDAERMTGSGSMGRPRTGIEVRLVDDEGREAETGAPGELLVKAPDIMSGYLNRPEATAEAIDPEGWFHTGDYVRSDEQGWMYFVGRKKDIVRRAGENIAASEVEEVLRSHPEVIDAAVVPVEDQLRGEEVLAHVYTASSEPQPVLAESLTELCAAKLARHKVPRYLLFTSEDFPRTPSMRVAKKKLPRGKVPAGAWDREG